jgi:hypothetical protein
MRLRGGIGRQKTGSIKRAGFFMRARSEASRQKKARRVGGLNPYQRRHGGDKSKYNEKTGATQHVK